ncbi:hypothetical protein AcW1_004249 [Taiwanofungus camphoratus]|nr:hypothetical protein AcW2_006740 [Antrodia cinnamomea]KAI0939130.1 hypothetical protein AcV5_000630 [Antrodia cinnamomea]KAI0939131.1 hypothetical protein AcV5_000630 [Antrodia cinnamomea]KAI0952049.1 hypothetical protein AcV7_007972 [Antrodia cinnamomea]KAI0959426.1 hypothetical protein AcW1_004249 [Antrodia cinnamomea]
MALDTGRYAIQNVRSMNHLQLPDPNDGSAVVAAPEDPATSLRWNIVKLGNGKYTIQNQGNASFANCGFRASPGAEVVGRNSGQQFAIQETRVRGRYTISPSDAQLCWGLPDDEIGTPVTLSPVYTDPRNHWVFIRA